MTNTADTNETQTEFKNENVEVAVSRNPGCQVKFEISVSPKAAEAAYHQAIKIVKKEISLPGFRKGKAPDSLVLQNYGQYVDREFRDCVVQTAFRESIKETKIYPFNDNSVKRPQVKSCSKEAGAKITIEFECEPAIPSVNPADLKLKKVEKKEITDQDVNKTIEDIRFHHAVWEDITDRPVQEGDFVDLDVDAIDEPGHNICTNSRFELKKGEIGNWMLKLVVGLKVGDHVEGMSEKEADDHVHTENCQHESHQHEFKPTRCRITVKSNKKAILPEINDDLAKKVGLQTVDELFPRVKADLERQADEHVRNSLRRQVEDYLIANYSYEVPESLVEGEFKSRLANKLSRLSHTHSQEQIVAKRQEIAEQVKKETREGLRLFFLTRKIAEEHKIQVTQNELLKEYSRQMWALPPGERAIDAETMKPEEIQSRLYLVVLSEKAKDHLVQQAQIQ